MSNRKGGEFEREISKYLTKWLTGKERPYQYWRMPGSGSLATIYEDNMGLSGDIRALTEEAKFLTDIFSIECKSGYPNTDFTQHLKGTKSFNIRIFWEQCCRDAQKACKDPMIIYRKKSLKPLVGIKLYHDDLVPPGLNSIPSIVLRFSKEILPSLALYDMVDFFDILTPDKIKEAWLKYKECL